MRQTIGQSIQTIAAQPAGRIIAQILQIDVLAVDTNGVVLSVSPSMVVNVHGLSGFKRAELSAGIDPKSLHVGDSVYIEKHDDRYAITGLLPVSNRTQAGEGSLGYGSNVEMIGAPIITQAIIAGSSIELAWTPIQSAVRYDVYASATANPSSDDARIVAQTQSSTWNSKSTGLYFDDGLYYAVMARGDGNTAGNLSQWVTPTFAGNYASGMTSKNQTTNIPGSLTVTKAGSILRADFTSLDSPQHVAIDVCDPQGAHPTTQLFANNDILRFVDANGNALWVKVNSATDKLTYWQYTVTKQFPAAHTNYTIPSGAQVADWGQSGQGVFLVSADGTFGAGTLWQIVTHDGSPWLGGSHVVVQVYADSAGKLLSGGGAIYQDMNGQTLQAGTSAVNKIKWVDLVGNVIAEFFSNYVGLSLTTELHAIGNTTETDPVIDLGADSNSGSYVAELQLDASDTLGRAAAKLGGLGFIGATIGTNDEPLSMADVKGAIGTATRAVSGNDAWAVADSTLYVSATSTQTLPDATTCAGRIHTVFLTNAGTTVTVVDAMGANINGAASDVLTVQYSSHMYQSNGTEWMIIAAA